MHIPTSMATQHPDSATRYVSIQEEPAEAVEGLSPPPDGLGIEELMIDFEGKMTPYHQTAEVAHKLLDAGLTPGRDVFITPRISSATEETVFRQLMALMSIIEADYDIAKAGATGAIRELILPMVSGPEDLVALRRRISDIVELAHKEFGLEKDPDALQVIPLVEAVPNMLAFEDLFRVYYASCGEAGYGVERMRFMIGRSDSALGYGLVSSVLATKLMLEAAYRLGEELGLVVAPILGGGYLPFRGHITPDNMPMILSDFAGVCTVTVQSGIRYDHELGEARRLVEYLKANLPAPRPQPYAPDEISFLRECIATFGKSYFEVLARIAPIAAVLSDIIPEQRDRLTRRGPIGYARPLPAPVELADLTADADLAGELRSLESPDVQSIPRAISFTGGMYSVGLPPEFLGLGEGLSALAARLGGDAVGRLTRHYRGFTNDVSQAARYLDLDVAARFFPADLVSDVRAGVEGTEKLLGIDLLGSTDRSYATLLEIVEPLVHQLCEGETIGSEDQALLRSCMVRLGKMRGSLG